MKIKSALAFFKWELIKIIDSVSRIYDNLTWRPKKKVSIDKIINSLWKGSSIFFIQVGANDGCTGDDLHKYITENNWRGILVEPVPYIFKRLMENYKEHTNLIFENSAIGYKNRCLPFYCLSEYDLSGKKIDQFLNGLSQLGSFDKRTLLKHSAMHPQFETFVKEINVQALTLNELFLKHSVNNIDLLQIDTEGYDFEILINANFEKTKPSLLIFEHLHMSRAEYKILLKKLKSIGYKFFINERDTLCVLSRLSNYME